MYTYVSLSETWCNWLVSRIFLSLSVFELQRARSRTALWKLQWSRSPAALWKLQWSRSLATLWKLQWSRSLAALWKLQWSRGPAALGATQDLPPDLAISAESSVTVTKNPRHRDDCVTMHQWQKYTHSSEELAVSTSPSLGRYTRVFPFIRVFFFLVQPRTKITLETWAYILGLGLFVIPVFILTLV